MVRSSQENALVEKMRRHIGTPGQAPRIHSMTRKLWKDDLKQIWYEMGIEKSDEKGATVAARRGARARCCAPRVEI